MEEEGLLVSVAFGRGGVCSKSWGRGGSNPGGEGEKETGWGRGGGWQETGLEKDRRKEPGL